MKIKTVYEVEYEVDSDLETEYRQKVKELETNKKDFEREYTKLARRTFMESMNPVESAKVTVITTVEEVEGKCEHSQDGVCYHSSSQGRLDCNGTELDKSICTEHTEIGG